MTSLSNIFPIGYPNIPTQEDLNFEVQDLLCHSQSPFDIIHYINDITCPYYRKALATLVPPTWHTMERNGKEPAVYPDSDGQWRITWLNIDSDIRRIIKQANAEQVEIELDQPQETLNSQPSTQNSTTMPLIIKGDPQVINHYEGAHYENCTFINSTPTTQSPIADSQNIQDVTPLPIANTPSLDLDKFRSLLTVPYLNRKRECEAMIELITRDGYNKKDHARMALVLYQSGNVALKREHITTFRQWWRICCELLQWEGADTCYRTSELTENELTKQILSYM